MVLPLAEYHCPRGLRRTLKRGGWKITFDTGFSEVVDCCSTLTRRGQEGTWITREMRAAYENLHDSGYAHSVECWKDDQLAGGLYGVSLGNIFFGESMFNHLSNASKVAFHSLVQQLKEWNFSLIDCQLPTEHLASLGARPWPRKTFLEALQKALRFPTKVGSWNTPAGVL